MKVIINHHRIKKQLEELENQDKTENPTNITLQTSKTNKKSTGTKE
jgi:hypothetical protein